MSKSIDEEKTYYGVLMNKRTISEDTYIFIPQHLIRGGVYEDEHFKLFIDEFQHEFFFCNDTDHVSSDVDNIVGLAISEEDLLSSYPDDCVEVAKQKYFDLIYERVYIGFYFPYEDTIKTASIPLDKLRNKLTNLNPGDKFEILSSDCEQSEKDNLNENLEEKDGSSLIVIESNTFKKILESTDVEMREQLKQIYNCFEEMNNHFVDQDETDEESIEQADEEVKQIKKNYVREMKAFFDAKIIGQDEAKKDVISAIVMNQLSDNSRNSCLLVGPTGSGKTLIAETVSEYFNMPMEIIDTTQLTMPGYVGANIEDFLVRLLVKSNGDLKKAENGIVVFDEIDKKGSQSNGDVAGKGVLNTLLPFLQGTTYNVKYQNSIIPFNTSKLTIFATGAFTDVVENKNEEKGCKNIGFSIETEKKEEKQDIEYKPLEISDFVKYGNMPVEIMGRFTTITQLTGHTKSSLRKILTESNISALLEEEKKLSKIGIALFWNDEYLNKVAEEALKLKTGARSLKTIVEKSIKEARWEVLENIDLYQAIFLTEESVSDNLSCQLIDNDDKFLNLRDILEQRKEEKQKIKTLSNPIQ